MPIPWPEKPVFQINDAEIPMLATEASIEIDCTLRGDPVGFAAVNRLADLIANSVEVVEGGGEIRSLMDIPTSAVLGRAINKSQRVAEINTVDELAEEARRIAQDLRSGTSIQKESLEKLEDFCIALAMEAASYGQSFFNRNNFIGQGNEDDTLGVRKEAP